MKKNEKKYDGKHKGFWIQRNQGTNEATPLSSQTNEKNDNKNEIQIDTARATQKNEVLAKEEDERKNVNNLTGKQHFSDLKAINVSQMRARNNCTG